MGDFTFSQQICVPKIVILAYEYEFWNSGLYLAIFCNSSTYGKAVTSVSISGVGKIPDGHSSGLVGVVGCSVGRGVRFFEFFDCFDLLGGGGG